MSGQDMSGQDTSGQGMGDVGMLSRCTRTLCMKPSCKRIPCRKRQPAKGRSMRDWGRALAPIAAWVAFAVAASQQPGWAAGPASSDAKERGPGGAPDREAKANASAKAAPVSDAAPAEAGARAPILYVPPSRGQARHTAGAGTRGPGPLASKGAPRPRIALLAPSDHVGRTVRSSPTLYWTLSAPTSTPIELTIIDDDAIEPLLRLRLSGPIEAGLHAVDLASLGVELPPDVIHRWFVALIHDPNHRSRDELVEGSIERIVPSAADRRAFGPTGSSPSAAALRSAALRSAEQGLWYDALAALAGAIEQAPEDGSLVADRRALLDQAKLGFAMP